MNTMLGAAPLRRSARPVANKAKASAPAMPDGSAKLCIGRLANAVMVLITSRSRQTL